MKVALVHDYLVEFGGAERVLEVLHQLFPQAPVYTAFIDRHSLGVHAERFKDWDIRETWITKLPFYKKLFSPYRVFAARAFASLDLSEFDVVISSSNAYMAKAVVPHKNAAGKPLHVCYCHTPPRALYGYTTKSNWRSNVFTMIGGELINHYMRLVDFQVSQRVDIFIANSKETKRRIKKFYHRDSMVIYPPVEVDQQIKTKLVKNKKSEKSNSGYFLYVNRLALAKHPELAVQVALSQGLSLKVVGTGPMLPELQQLVESHKAIRATRQEMSQIEFVGAVSDQELQQLYAGARALLYPVEDEDFGMVPVEAMACGVPVIAHQSGGPQETIKAGVSGVFFPELTVESLKTGIEQFIELEEKAQFKPQEIKQYAQKFGRGQFEQKILSLIEANE